MLLIGALSALTACAESVTGSVELPPLTVTSVLPTPVVPGTIWVVRGSGFLPEEVAGLMVEVRGDVDGFQVDVSLRPIRHADDELAVAVSGELQEALFGTPPVAGHFSGTLGVRRVAGGDTIDVAALPVEAPLEVNLQPSLTALTPLEWYPGDRLSVSGSGFLHPSEGLSLARLDGTFTLLSPPRVVPIAGLMVPAVSPNPESRDSLEWILTPDLLGIRPGAFTGTVTIINQSSVGLQSESGSLELDGVPLRRPVITDVSPLVASRGQRVTFEGRGLLPPDGLLQATSLLLLEGQFDPTRGPTLDLTGINSLALFPDPAQDNTQVTVTLRVDVGVNGERYGLGLLPGHFDGAVTPMLVSGPDSVRGDPFPLVIEILPALQLVYIKFLPSFDDALDDFGLTAARDQVIARVLEVTARDYAGVNVAFTDAPPTDHAEYAVAEVGGRDPNGTHLFGLDNTAGKDVGNLRFDDVIGGFNAETRARGYAAYGGIFPAEFLQMSPTLNNSSQASPRFDDIFGPVSGPLGGEAATTDEVSGVGPRADIVAEAVRVFANLVGNTISHEVGHSLGLTAIDGQFHNTGDNPEWIMDAGSFRPFEERAEVDGQGPEVFSPTNRAYLEQVLPVD